MKSGKYIKSIKNSTFWTKKCKGPKICHANCNNNLESNLPYESVLGDTFSGFKQN